MNECNILSADMKGKKKTELVFKVLDSEADGCKCSIEQFFWKQRNRKNAEKKTCRDTPAMTPLNQMFSC